MRLTVVGCGDAFGSGGRLQTCYHVDTGAERFLVDCGATSILGMNRLGLSANDVGTILISHLHGDHFGGLVWWLLHAQHIVKRRVPLTVAGPPGIEARFIAAAEALFPGSTGVKRRYDLVFRELAAGTPQQVGPVLVTAQEVRHPSGAPSYGLRMEVAGRTLAFSGDTEWVETLVPVGREADLFIMECYAFDGEVRYHMSWEVIAPQLARVGARRVLLTHMNEGMLARTGEVRASGVELAHDGLVIDL